MPFLSRIPVKEMGLLLAVVGRHRKEIARLNEVVLSVVYQREERLTQVFLTPGQICFVPENVVRTLYQIMMIVNLIGIRIISAVRE